MPATQRQPPYCLMLLLQQTWQRNIQRFLRVEVRVLHSFSLRSVECRPPPLIHPSLAIERLGAHCKSRKLVNLCSGLPLVVSKLGWRKEKEKETEEQKETERKRKRKRNMNGDEWLPGGGGASKNGAFFVWRAH